MVPVTVHLEHHRTHQGHYSASVRRYSFLDSSASVLHPHKLIDICQATVRRLRYSNLPAVGALEVDEDALALDVRHL